MLNLEEIFTLAISEEEKILLAIYKKKSIPITDPLY